MASIRVVSRRQIITNAMEAGTLKDLDVETLRTEALSRGMTVKGKSKDQIVAMLERATGADPTPSTDKAEG